MPSYKFFLIIIMTISTSTSAWEEGFVYNDDVKIAYRDYGPIEGCLLYTSPSPRDAHESRMPSSA